MLTRRCQTKSCRRIKQTKQRAVSVQQQQRHLLERMSEKAAREAALQAQLERQVAENQKLKQEHERVRCVGSPLLPFAS
jgi:hypothetical protein